MKFTRAIRELTLSTVSVCILLPRNTTSKIRPLDAGVIYTVKVRYGEFQMEPEVHLLNETVLYSDVYKVDVPPPMRAISITWE